MRVRWGWFSVMILSLLGAFVASVIPEFEERRPAGVRHLMIAYQDGTEESIAIAPEESAWISDYGVLRISADGTMRSTSHVRTGIRSIDIWQEPAEGGAK